MQKNYRQVQYSKISDTELQKESLKYLVRENVENYKDKTDLDITVCTE